MAFAKNSLQSDMDRFAMVLLCLVPVLAVGSARHMPQKQIGTNEKLPARNEFKPSADVSVAEASDEEVMEILRMCNATYNAPIGFVTALNETGRFPADASHDSKCYLLCILSNLKAADEKGKLDASTLGKLLAPEHEDFAKCDTVMKCLKQEIRNKDACEQVYERMNCIFQEAMPKHDGM